jgi:hypothetical protein
MITDDDLRALITSDEIPGSLSPSSVRARAQRIRLRRRLGTAGVALAIPAIALATLVLPGRGASSIDGVAGYPPAFDGNGNALPIGPDGKVALEIPHLTAWVDSQALCLGHVVGDYVQSDLPSGCIVSGTAGYFVQVVNGVIGSFTEEPVARADFILGKRVVHAQVVGFARHPQWRTLTARWDGPDSGVLIRGWDASGKLILSQGCTGGCPIPAEPSQPVVAGPPAPAASSAPPTPPTPDPTAVPDGNVSVIDGVEAYPAPHGICVGDQHASHCVTDGDAPLGDGFPLGKDIAVTIIGRPVARAEFLVGSTPIEATVLGFASHPQWRVVAANLKLPGSAGKPVRLRGWDADGKLVVDDDPPAANH